MVSSVAVAVTGTVAVAELVLVALLLWILHTTRKDVALLRKMALDRAAVSTSPRARIRRRRHPSATPEWDGDQHRSGVGRRVPGTAGSGGHTGASVAATADYVAKLEAENRALRWHHDSPNSLRDVGGVAGAAGGGSSSGSPGRGPGPAPAASAPATSASALRDDGRSAADAGAGPRLRQGAVPLVRMTPPESGPLRTMPQLPSSRWTRHDTDRPAEVPSTPVTRQRVLQPQSSFVSHSGGFATRTTPAKQMAGALSMYDPRSGGAGATSTSRSQPGRRLAPSQSYRQLAASGGGGGGDGPSAGDGEEQRQRRSAAMLRSVGNSFVHHQRADSATDAAPVPTPATPAFSHRQNSFLIASKQPADGAVTQAVRNPAYRALRETDNAIQASPRVRPDDMHAPSFTAEFMERRARTTADTPSKNRRMSDGGALVVVKPEATQQSARAALVRRTAHTSVRGLPLRATGTAGVATQPTPAPATASGLGGGGGGGWAARTGMTIDTNV